MTTTTMSTPSPKTAKMPIKVVLVEDHQMFREWLAHLITKKAAATVCGEADNIKDALEIIKKTDPDIALVDISLRGSSGLELIKDLKAHGLNVPVLVLSMHEETLYAERVLRAALVEDDRVVGQREGGVREAGRHPDDAMIRARELDRRVVPERGRAVPHVHHDVEHRAVHAAH